MKVTNINSAQTFTNSKKSKFKFNNKLGTNITASESNQNGRWFYSKCDDPSYRVFIDEIKPEVVNKPKTVYEYYNIKRDENSEDILTPVEGEIIMQNGKVQVVNGDNVYDFSGVSYKKQNGELVQEVRHAKGYPFYVTEYQNGEEYKYIRYSQNSHRINQIYFYDGSFELSQKTPPQNAVTTIELQTKDRYCEKTAVQFTATRKDDINGSAVCEIPSEDGYKTITLNWTYPNVKYSFWGNAKDAKSLQDVLLELKKVINNEEYKEDFGSCGVLNIQLNDAIGYLEDIRRQI